MLARTPLVVAMARNMHPIIPQLSSYCAAAVIFSMPRDDRAEGTTEWARVLDTGDVPPEGSETRRVMLTLSPPSHAIAEFRTAQAPSSGACCRPKNPVSQDRSLTLRQLYRCGDKRLCKEDLNMLQLGHLRSGHWHGYGKLLASELPLPPIEQAP